MNSFHQIIESKTCPFCSSHTTESKKDEDAHCSTWSCNNMHCTHNTQIICYEQGDKCLRFNLNIHDQQHELNFAISILNVRIIGPYVFAPHTCFPENTNQIKSILTNILNFS